MNRLLTLSLLTLFELASFAGDRTRTGTPSRTVVPGTAKSADQRLQDDLNAKAAGTGTGGTGAAATTTSPESTRSSAPVQHTTMPGAGDVDLLGNESARPTVTPTTSRNALQERRQNNETLGATRLLEDTLKQATDDTTGLSQRSVAFKETELAKLLAKTNPTDEEKILIQALKDELAEALKAQEELRTREPVNTRGTEPKTLVKATAELYSTFLAQKAKMEKAVEAAFAAGKAANKDLVNDFMKNALAIYSGKGYLGKTDKDAELKGLVKAKALLEELDGDRLVGYLKFLSEYGTAYRNARGSSKSIRDSHLAANGALKTFIEGRSQGAASVRLRDPKELRKTLCECTGACAA